MQTSLRPLNLGEILDRTASLYRSNFLLFAGISAVYAGITLVLNLLQIGISQLTAAMHLAGWARVLLWTTGGVYLLLIFIFAGAGAAANNRAVAWVNLGEPATIAGAYRSIRPRLRRYLWLMTLTALIVWTPLAAVYGGYLGLLAYYLPKGFLSQPGVASTMDQSTSMIFGLASVVFVLLLIPAGFYTILMGLRYSLAIPACVVENLKARAALRRSVELSKGSRGRVFVLLMLVLVIQFGLTGISQSPFMVIGFKSHGMISPWLRALQQIIAFFTNTFVGPIYATGLTLFYYDQRIRNEGYDIEWMMQAAGLAIPPPPAEIKDDPEPAGEFLPAAGLPAAAAETQPPESGLPHA